MATFPLCMLLRCYEALLALRATIAGRLSIRGGFARISLSRYAPCSIPTRRRRPWFLVVLFVRLLATAALSLSPTHHDPTYTHTYIALYKPALTLCSLQSDADRAQRKHREPRQTLHDLSLPQKLHVCGRLDRDSEGLLLLTDDGKFTQQVRTAACHKTYWVLIRGQPSDEALHQMRQGGLLIRGAVTRPPVVLHKLVTTADFSQLQLLPPACHGMNRPGGTWLRIVLNEGRHRQIRRITASAGHATIRLVRVQIGLLGIAALDENNNNSNNSAHLLDAHKKHRLLLNLKPGQWTRIRKEQVVRI